jgi:hypothetical protein
MFSATKSDFDRVDVPGVLVTVEPTCFNFSGVLHARGNEAGLAGDDRAAAVLSLLADISSYALRADNPREPFGPRAIFDNKRTPSIEDLEDDQLAFLVEIHESVAVADLRARVADVLFVRKRHHRFASVALDAYLESAARLLTPTDWVEASHRFERSLAIAVTLKTERDRVVDIVTSEAEQRRGDTSYFTAKLMQALMERRLGNPEVMASLAEAAATKAAAQHDWDRAREYLLLASQWHRKNSKTDEALRARQDAAESYVKLAEIAPTRFLEATHLERAIHALRTMPGNHARVDELHRRLMAVQVEALQEFKEIGSASMNLGEIAAKARSQVAGKTFQNAVAELVLLWHSAPTARLREEVTTTARDAPFFSAIQKIMVNRQGKVVSKRGSLLAGTPEQREEALRQAMFERAAQQREGVVASAIKPARAQIFEEHFIDVRDLLAMTTASRFVPAGREELFALGFVAGLTGNDAVALHLLMPQLEHAVRTLLAQSGALTSKVDDDGIQDERDLGWLLYQPEAKEVFGEDLLFDMQGLLVERSGSNLRNLMAHGLLDPDQCIQAQSTYFWWLTLRLVVWPLLDHGEVPAQ